MSSKLRLAYLKPVHRYAYRSETKKYGMITGFYLSTSKDLTERPCFQITFEDGEVDYVPLSEVNDGVFEICGLATEDNPLHEEDEG